MDFGSLNNLTDGFFRAKSDDQSFLALEIGREAARERNDSKAKGPEESEAETATEAQAAASLALKCWNAIRERRRGYGASVRYSPSSAALVAGRFLTGLLCSWRSFFTISIPTTKSRSTATCRLSVLATVLTPATSR